MEERMEDVRKDPINPKTTWPAVILAASRKDKVKGRTRALTDSINTRKGFSQSGAPDGRREAVAVLVSYEKPETINAIHKGRPKDRVKIKWLEALKV